MKNIVKLALSGIVLYNLVPETKSRHKPKLPEKENLTFENPYVIEEPEISLALYGELTGEPHYYKIDSKEEFDFYVGILTPLLKSEEDTKDSQEGSLDPKNKVYFKILDEDKNEITFEGYQTGILKDHKWVPWYEEYGKQWYWTGPQIGKEFKHDDKFKDYNEGEYYIKVFNEENKGKYSLAVGDQEKFSIWDIFKLPSILPKINKLWEE